MLRPPQLQKMYESALYRCKYLNPLDCSKPVQCSLYTYNKIDNISFVAKRRLRAFAPPHPYY